jgi:hypothetical protein
MKIMKDMKILATGRWAGAAIPRHPASPGMLPSRVKNWTDRSADSAEDRRGISQEFGNVPDFPIHPFHYRIRY